MVALYFEFCDINLIITKAINFINQLNILINLIL
jgi:hypothetical protein